MPDSAHVSPPYAHRHQSAHRAVTESIDERSALALSESRFPAASSTRPIRTGALAPTMRVRFTRDVAVQHTPENGERQGGQDIMTEQRQGAQNFMTRTPRMPQVTRLSNDAEGAASQRRDAEPIADSVLADAEEEEFAQLWAADPGNQGA